SPGPFRRRSPVYGEYDGSRRDSDASDSRNRGSTSRGGRGRYGNRKASPHRRGGRDRSKSPVHLGNNRPRKKRSEEHTSELQSRDALHDALPIFPRTIPTQKPCLR